MEILQAIFLGIIQGVTEVLPISSSGHLVLVPWFFGFSDPGLVFDVALHLGTLVAIITYFRKDWLEIAKSFFAVLTKRQISSKQDKLPFYIILATVPGALAGYFFEDQAESTFRNPILIAIMISVFAFVLLAAEKSTREKKETERNWRDSLLVGVVQALAILPGVSRSGITISGGMFSGFSREAAARFSFLISAPIIFGAAVFSVRHLTGDFLLSGIFWAGFLAAVISSFFSVKFMMNFVRSHKLNVFAYYRFFLAAVIVVFYLFGAR